VKRPYMKFYPRDWQANTELQTCSLEARGAWIECMCIMAQSSRYGYLVDRAGKPMALDAVSRLIRADLATVEACMGQLEASGVFSRDDAGAIYSRRMVRDAEAAAVFADAGRRGGGNPRLHPTQEQENTEKIKPIPIPIPIPTEGLKVGYKPTFKGQDTDTGSVPEPVGGDAPAPKAKRAYSPDFEAFWQAYPLRRRVGKLGAFRKWEILRRAGTLPDMDAIMTALDAQTHSEAWRRDGGQYIPAPLVWLNQGRWDDYEEASER